MKKKRKFGRKLLSFLLTLAMVIGLMPGMGLTAYADGTTYNPASEYHDYDNLISNDTEVTISEVSGQTWYVIAYNSSSSTVTLLSKQPFGSSMPFNDDVKKGHDYVGSDIEAYVEGLINDGQPLAGIKDALADISGKVTGNPSTISGAVPYLLSYDVANVLSETKKKGSSGGSWWLRSPGIDDSTIIRAACVKDGNASESGNWVSGRLPVRLALQLDLSKVVFDSATKTFSLLVSYPLWVGDTQVTSANANNIDGDGKASYNAETQTLKLNNYSYSGAGHDANISCSTAAITTSENLNIIITGMNSLKCTSISGIYVDGNLTISGTGSLTAEGEYFGIYNDSGSATISSGIVTAIGSSYAIYGSIKNTIAGTGWTDIAGTQGMESIAISDEGRWLTSFHKVQFPEVKDPAKVTTTPKANDLTYNGQAQELVTAGEAEGGTMQYALGIDDKTAPTTGWSDKLPTATDAGTYYVWYKAVGDATHSDSNPVVVTITISEETPAEPETDDGKTETEQKGSAPDDEKTSIDNDLTEIREIVSGEASVDDSDTVRLILNTNSVDENADENKEAVDSIKSKIEADNLNIGSFLDITLSFIVEDANGAEKSSGQLEELNGRSLSVRFPIPSKLQASGRLFRIFRFHGGKTEEVGSERGDAVVLSLDKFSLYAIAYEDGAAPEETEESEKKVVKPHTHTYAWDKVEATESQDGELRYQCTECYDILVRVPLSAYYVFNANTVDKINKAKQGETVKITTDRWISFHKMVFDALAARPDVSLEVSFLDGEYKGNRVSFTIPAGADNSDLFTENNFAGFRYLGNKYGLTAEEN